MVIVKDGKAEVIGDGTKGLTLDDLRQFVEMTQDFDGSAWVDGRVGSDRQIAAIMDLIVQP